MHRSQAPASRLVLAVAAIIAVTVLAGTGFAPASTGQYFTVTGHVSLGSPGVAAGAGDVEVGWGAVTSNPDPGDEAATDAVPPTIISQLSDLEVSTVVLLGGTSALGVPVSTLTECD